MYVSAFDDALARQILDAAVSHARSERAVPGYVPSGGIQYVSVPAWVAEALQQLLDPTPQAKSSPTHTPQPDKPQ